MMTVAPPGDERRRKFSLESDLSHPPHLGWSEDEKSHGQTESQCASENYAWHTGLSMYSWPQSAYDLLCP